MLNVKVEPHDVQGFEVDFGAPHPNFELLQSHVTHVMTNFFLVLKDQIYNPEMRLRDLKELRDEILRSNTQVMACHENDDLASAQFALHNTMAGAVAHLSVIIEAADSRLAIRTLFGAASCAVISDINTNKALANGQLTSGAFRVVMSLQDARVIMDEALTRLPNLAKLSAAASNKTIVTQDVLNISTLKTLVYP